MRSLSPIEISLLIAGLFFYVLLALMNPLFAPVNVKVRIFIEQKRNRKLLPLMILTHRYHDVLSLSVQVMLLALLLGYAWDDWRRAMILTSAMFVQTTWVGLSKRITSITRPPQQISHIFMKSSSYPSGHTAASMTFAFLVPMVLQPYVPPAIVIPVMIYLILAALLTAYGRLYLDVHWLTDLIGGWILSGLTLLLSRLFLI